MTGIRGQRSVEGLLVDWSVAQPLPDRGVPVALLTRAQKAAELQRVQELESALAAYKIELVAGFAADRPASLDRRPGEPGAAAPGQDAGP